MKNALVALTLALTLAPAHAAAQSAEEPLIRVIGATSRSGATSAVSLGSRPVPADPESYRGLAAADASRAVIIDFANCLLKSERAASMKFMQMVPGSQGFGDVAKAMADNQCIAVGDMSFRPTMLYGASYIARYREAHRQSPATLVAEPIDFVGLGKGLTGEALQFYVSSRRFGDCVARRDVKVAHDLVTAVPGGSAEGAAFAAVTPNLSACLVAGTELKLTKDFIKGLLAEVLVRSAVS